MTPADPPTNSPPSSASSSCRWAGLNTSAPAVSPSVLHQGSLPTCSSALWASRARAAIGPEGLRKDSASVTVTSERGGASVERGRGVTRRIFYPLSSLSLSLVQQMLQMLLQQNGWIQSARGRLGHEGIKSRRDFTSLDFIWKLLNP